MSTNKDSGFPRCPPGLEHVDTATNLKALSKLSFGIRSASDITINIIPPTARIDGTLNDRDELDEKLQNIDESYPPYTPTMGNCAYAEPVILTLFDQPEPSYFLPAGLLEDNESEEMDFIQNLDLQASVILRRPCNAPYCLRARAYQITDYIAQKGGVHYGPEDLFLPVSSPSASRSSSASDCSEDSSVPLASVDDLEGYTFRSHTPGSTTSEATSSSSLDVKRNSTGHPGLDKSGAVYFHRSLSEGALLSDVKALKPGSLLGPEEDVMAFWGMPESPTWIRIMINQHGYAKKSVCVPTRCYCANTTRAGLAFDIASLLDLYFSNVSVRPGFENCPTRRQNIEHLYLHSVRQNVDDPCMVWRILVSDSAVSWSKY